MLKGFLILLGCQLTGECLHHLLSIPLPGPVLGMFLLALSLLRWPSLLPGSLNETSQFLLGYLGLLFVPAGVGAITNLNLIISEWIPITVALISSTFLSLVVTAAVMHAVCSNQEKGGLTGSESGSHQKGRNE